jgi:hypothetical protein
MLSVICFSKDRPLQLEAYLDSLMYYSGIKPQFITVLTTASPGISYDRLFAQYPLINWVREQAFQADLLQAVRAAENFVLFGCDDVVFKEHFDVNDCIKPLEADTDVFGFSLRLGTNLNFLPKLADRNGIYYWNWRDARGEYWSYPWEVSASVYRKQFVLNYLESRADISNPNRFEAYLAGSIAAATEALPTQLACFPKSTCATITVNRVQDEFPNGFDQTKDTSPEALYREHVNGLKQNWMKLANWSNNSVHVGADAFELVQSVGVPAAGYVRLSQVSGRPSGRKSNIALKILWWRVMTKVWETIRALLPRSILNLLKKLLRKVSGKAM